MKSLITGLLATALMITTSCNDANKAGGPGAAAPNTNQPGPPDESTFTLAPPDTTTTLKQGESKAAVMGIRRNKGFDQNVMIRFDNLPKGVSIAPTELTLKDRSEEAKFTFTVADDAALGEFTIKAIGHPTRGADASNELKVIVTKK